MPEQPRKAYATDLTDPQWDILQPLLPIKTEKERNQEVDLREIVNAIFYLLRTGCQWRNLPHASEVISGRHMAPCFIIFITQ